MATAWQGPLGKVMGNFCGFLRIMLFLTSPASPASSKLLGMILHTAFFYFCIVFAVAETTKQSLQHWCQ